MAEGPSQATFQIVVMGIFVCDLSFWTPTPPGPGETALASRFAMGPGGKGSNQAVAAARAGARVAFLSRIGDDQFGRMARALYAREGISDALLIDAPGEATGAAMVMIDETTGENRICVHPGSAWTMAPADLDRADAAIDGAAIVMAQLEQPLDLIAAALQRARAAGAVTILDPAPARPRTQEIYAAVDWLTPNEGEAAALTGQAVDDVASAGRAAEILRARGAAGVIVTLGAGGALLLDDEGAEAIPPATMGEALDPTGAGDAFNGAFAARLAAGAPAREAARYAQRFAALSVTRAGAAASLPSREEAAALLECGEI